MDSSVEEEDAMISYTNKKGGSIGEE